MKNNNAKLWDCEAEKPMTEHVRGKYLTSLFTNAVNKSLELTEPKEKIKILKVDLWNEGIDFERNILKHYVKEKFELYGIDISKKVCSSAHHNQPQIKTSNGSITSLAFKNNSFDVILDLSTSDHLPPENIPCIFEEYSRCLKENGALTLIFDWWGFFWKHYLKYIENKYKRTDSEFFSTNKPKRYIHQIEFMKHEVQKHFEIKKEYCIDYFGWTWNRFTKPFWDRMPKLAHTLLLKLEFSRISKFLKPFAKQYVIIAKKKQNEN